VKGFYYQWLATFQADRPVQAIGVTVAQGVLGERHEAGNASRPIVAI